MRIAWNTRRTLRSASSARARAGSARRTASASARVVASVLATGLERAGDAARVRLVGVLARAPATSSRTEARASHCGGREPVPGVHAHVERPVLLEREAARGVVDLHRRDAEVGEDEVGALGPADLGEQPRASAAKFVRRTTRALSSCPSARRRASLRGSSSGSTSSASSRPPGARRSSSRSACPPQPERAVDAALARPRREHLEHLLDQDRHVLPRRRLPAPAHVRDELGVSLGRVLLVLLLEAPRVRAAVARRRRRRRGLGCRLGHGSADHDRRPPAREPTLDAEGGPVRPDGTRGLLALYGAT